VNLLAEGIDSGAIHEVGNVMIDTLEMYRPAAEAAAVPDALGVVKGSPYVLVTLHRPATVDDDGRLHQVLEALNALAHQHCPVIFPVHPRTRARLRIAGDDRLRLIPPVGYLEFVSLQKHAALVITDSGGVQVEAAYLGTPCLTFRESTEWPETVSGGANTLIGHSPQALLAAASQALQSTRKRFTLPKNWDGHAADRIAEVLERKRSSLTS
jgi:UDP-N-acetylglucosamine 2-epimerase (non-hydrolysing)